MTVLSAHKLAKYFGERCLFDGVTFDIDEHDKVGLVGTNGCGKTTLFRLLTGEYTADGGDVTRAKDTRIGYMEQHVQCAGSSLYTMVESVFAPLIEQERALDTLTKQLETDHSAALIEKHQALQEAFTNAGGLYYKNRVRATLLGLGFAPDELDRPLETFSGGQRSKAAMARLLLSGSNLLLLDEPTNHLDIAAVEWLEDFLRNYDGAVVVISHDRYFLDRVTTRTWELRNGTLYATNGNYTAHCEQRKKDADIAAKHYKHAMQEIKKLEENIALLKQWNREKSVKQAESREKRLEKKREQLVTPEQEAASIRFDFTAAQTSGNEVLNAEEITMAFGDKPLFQNAELHIRRGERVFLLGPNGCGKTTLLKILKGDLTPKRGLTRLGAKVTVGYYDQTQAGLNDSKTVIDEIWDSYPTLTQTEIRNALAAFLFRGEDVFRPVGQMSGGERARVLLLKLMLARDNFLLLDEPTNHLDIASREALEEALAGYDGTLLVVSHDRYFINRMASRVVRLTPDGCTSFDGNYDAYAAAIAPAPAPKTAQTAPVGKGGEDYRRRKEEESLRRRRQTQLSRLEDEIGRTEEAVADLEAQLSEASDDYTRVLELTAALDEHNRRLDEMMTQWETLQQEIEEDGTP